ncbi:MAG: SGNH/GDSL hydrolase family protein [Victivallaceae bacterium]|nr:SGNH/GDSL hydrolase family protein [Victivallaceae bacterium]
MSENKSISEIDEFMAVKPVDADGISWHLPGENPFRLTGFYNFERDHRYERLSKVDFPPEVTWFPDGKPQKQKQADCGTFLLMPHTAGGQIQFCSDSGRLLISGELRDTGGMDHMAYTGSAGFDVYIKDGEPDSVWKYFRVTRFDHAQTKFSCSLTPAPLTRKMRSYLIHFPLYNAVKSLAIGLDDNAAITAPAPWCDDRPIVWYGTSIDQGACATRPGLAATNQISRRLNRPVLNFGFSGSAHGEPEIAAMLAGVKDPVMYIINYDWNVKTPEEMSASLPGFIDILRTRHPSVPIMLISHTLGADFVAEAGGDARRNFEGKRRVLMRETDKRRAAGDRAIEFVDGDRLLGDDWWECLVDGCHLNDIGFYRETEYLLPVIRRIIDRR